MPVNERSFTVAHPSISAFFPCYNDALTIGAMVELAAATLQRLTDDFEVIVVNDGSTDSSGSVLAGLQHAHPFLRVVTHERNTGYGGALRSGFAAATKELIFYTDGDAQYDPGELADLYAALTPDVDVVQGWKLRRHDAWYRRLAGWSYSHAVRILFGISVRDVDCDFRLIRSGVLSTFELTSTSGSITVELVARLERGGFAIRELPVHHYARPYGRSQFFSVGRIAETFGHLAGLWLDLHLAPETGELARPVVPIRQP